MPGKVTCTPATVVLVRFADGDTVHTDCYESVAALIEGELTSSHWCGVSWGSKEHYDALKSLYLSIEKTMARVLEEARQEELNDGTPHE